MWIKHNDKLINADQLIVIWKEKTKIYGNYDGSYGYDRIVLGEFWTQKEADDIFRTITRNLLSDTGMIIRDTRDGTRCLKKKK